LCYSTILTPSENAGKIIVHSRTIIVEPPFKGANDGFYAVFDSEDEAMTWAKENVELNNGLNSYGKLTPHRISLNEREKNAKNKEAQREA